MAFAFDPRRPLPRELRRVVRKQLKLAVLELRGARVHPDDRAVHEARRRIKKARAALRLCRPWLGARFSKSSRRLGRVSRMLAPIADSEAMVRVFATLLRPPSVAPGTFAVRSIGHQLEHHRQTVYDGAVRRRCFERAARLLARERRRVGRWRLDDADATANVRAGLARTVRRSRRAMTRAIARPTEARFHTWRRRVKDHWLQLRLMDTGSLTADVARLERLDAALGACHDVALLTAATRRATPPLERRDIAGCLRSLRGERTARRRESVAVGRAVYGESTRACLARATEAWADPPRTSSKERTRPCQPAA